jgi:hypothetical protein
MYHVQASAPSSYITWRVARAAITMATTEVVTVVAALLPAHSAYRTFALFTGQNDPADGAPAAAPAAPTQIGVEDPIGVNQPAVVAVAPALMLIQLGPDVGVPPQQLGPKR